MHHSSPNRNAPNRQHANIDGKNQRATANIDKIIFTINRTKYTAEQQKEDNQDRHADCFFIYLAHGVHPAFFQSTTEEFYFFCSNYN